METHTRSMEIDQAFSLTQISPQALLDLKTKGQCEFTVPELYFDLFYPGQYRRRVKSARLTIPCITGPYSNVSAVLSLKDSYLRKEAKLNTEGGELTMVPPSRSTTVATSTAQNDSGVFKLDFRDERYMPFEGAGAVESTWQLELPKNFRPFDYSSINDVLLHISYTAEYDHLFRERVEAENQYLDTILSNGEFLLSRIFSLRQEFSQTFHRFMYNPEGEAAPLKLSEKHFPLFLQGKPLAIESAAMIIELDENGFRDDAGAVHIPPALHFEIAIQGSGAGEATISEWEGEPGINAVSGTITVAGILDGFLPASQPLHLSIRVNDAGDLASEASTPGDSSALDDHKIKDLYLHINYRVAND